MLNKYTVLAVVLAALWMSWLFRYDLHNGHPLVLDRWTGEIAYHQEPFAPRK